MPDVFFDLYTWGVIAFVALIGVVVGRVRHEPPLATAANVVGVAALLLGGRWATAIGQEAFSALALATGGMALWMTGAYHGGRPRRPPEEERSRA